MKKIIFIIVLIVIGLIIYKFNYCNYNPTKPTIFYPIYTRLDTCMKYEAFVVSNAPCDTSLLKRLIEKFDIVKADVAEKALPYCNITYIAGADMVEPMDGYLQVLFDQNAESVGGALPGDDFYYEG